MAVEFDDDYMYTPERNRLAYMDGLFVAEKKYLIRSQVGKACRRWGMGFLSGNGIQKADLEVIAVESLIRIRDYCSGNDSVLNFDAYACKGIWIDLVRYITRNIRDEILVFSEFVTSRDNDGKEGPLSLIDQAVTDGRVICRDTQPEMVMIDRENRALIYEALGERRNGKGKTTRLGAECMLAQLRGDDLHKTAGRLRVAYQHLLVCSAYLKKILAKDKRLQEVAADWGIRCCA